jgi:hypothetical protein
MAIQEVFVSVVYHGWNKQTKSTTMNRNLDAEVVKTIFKWRYIPVSGDYHGEYKCEILFPPDEEPDQDFYNTLPRVGKVHEGWHAPMYSDNLLLSIQLAKHVKLPGLISEMSTNPEDIVRSCLVWWISNAGNV